MIIGHKAIPFRYGKAPARIDSRTLKMATYLKPGLPAPPTSYSVLSRLKTQIGTDNVSKLFPMDGNDRYGDCGFAAGAHASTAYHGLVGKKVIPCSSNVIKTYLKWTGGVDEGTVLLHFLKYWTKNEVFGEKISAFVSIDPHDFDDARRAIFYFGGIYLGFQVQRDAIKDFQLGLQWTPGVTDGSGHCVFILGYDAGGVYVLTWGGIIYATWDWFKLMVDEAYVLMPDVAKIKLFNPGVDYAQLEKDLAAIKMAA